MVINNAFEIAEIVYLITDTQQKKRVVTAIIVCPDDSYLYELSCGVENEKHYDFEISREVDLSMKIDA